MVAQPWRGWLACWALGVLAGCASWPSSTVDRGLAALSDQGFVPVQTTPAVKAWLKMPSASQGFGESQVLHVYLEGDGAAWWAQRLPPADPTPRNSVSLPLAGRDAHRSVAYLARPCQFLSEADRATCPVAWWTDERWGEAVVSLTMAALDRLLQASSAQELVLVGHSGGGTLALLTAARRRDVRCVVTIASPLDTQAWARGHELAPLTGSLNPADTVPAQRTFQERHLLGALDRIVPLTSVGRYLVAPPPAGQLLLLPEQGHSRGWVEQWYPSGDRQTSLTDALSGCLAGR